MLPVMSPGGQWFMPPYDGAIPVYVPLKQLEAHRKRLVADDGYMPIADPRKEEDYPPAQLKTEQAKEELPNAREIAMQARIDQLESMVMRLLAQNGATDGSQKHDEQPDSKNPAHDRGPSGRKSTVPGQ